MCAVFACSVAAAASPDAGIAWSPQRKLWTFHIKSFKVRSGIPVCVPLCACHHIRPEAGSNHEVDVDHDDEHAWPVCQSRGLDVLVVALQSVYERLSKTQGVKVTWAPEILRTVLLSAMDQPDDSER